MNAARTRRFDPHSDGLTASVRHQSSVRSERIGVWQSESPNTSLGMCVTDDLPARQDASQQNRTRVIAKIFRFVVPLGDESPKIQLRRHHVFVQVEHRETVRRIPAATLLPRITRIKRIGPCRIGDTPPDVRIGNRFAPQFQGHACTLNICSAASSGPSLLIIATVFALCSPMDRNHKSTATKVNL